MISTATIIDEKGNKKKGVVGLGSTVVIEDLDPEDDEDKKQEYAIVGTTEADPFEGKISNESPIGAAILGKKVGSTVTVRTPSGDHKYKIFKGKVRFKER
jgi:transcription elongation factor GreA